MLADIAPTVAQPISQIIVFLYVLPIFLVSLTFHEYAHGWMAYRYGDDMAKRMGRLTLNPLAHISLIGTIILPLLVRVGWAKPVPVDFSILNKKQRFNVAVAGIVANVLLALLLAASFHFFNLQASTMLGNYVLLGVFFNLILAAFNLLPIYPLDGSHIHSIRRIPIDRAASRNVILHLAGTSHARIMVQRRPNFSGFLHIPYIL